MEDKINHNNGIYIRKTDLRIPGYLGIVRYKLAKHLIEDWKIQLHSESSRIEYIINSLIKLK
jgi:hypothetical protein